MEKKNNSDNISKFFDKASEIGKKAADGVQKGAKVVVEKTKEANQEYRQKQQERKTEKEKKKLNPLFPKDIKKKDFHLPNIIEIVDEAPRRDVAICKGSIGWRSMEKVGKDKKSEVEVLHIYDENINDIGVQFVPVPKCDTIYCVDPYDRTRYIRTDCIFGKVTEEKIAELEHIAYSLGAKRCSIQIMEENKDDTSREINVKASANQKSELKYKSNKAGTDNTASPTTNNSRTSNNLNKLSGKKFVEFAGHNSPRIPKLKWFAYDDNVRNLINMRCTDINSVKTSTLELNGSMSATMSTKTACAIDNIFKNYASTKNISATDALKISASANMERQAIKEQNSKLIFEVEF